MAQIGDVYEVRYTGVYRSVAAALSIFKLKVLSWLPGLHGKCLFLPTLADELWFFVLTPIVLSAVCLAMSYGRRASFVPAYPYVLGITFLVFPAISSRGFRCECDCTHAPLSMVLVACTQCGTFSAGVGTHAPWPAHMRRGRPTNA